MDVVERMRRKTARHKTQDCKTQDCKTEDAGNEEISHLMKWIHRKGAQRTRREWELLITSLLISHHSFPLRSSATFAALR